MTPKDALENAMYELMKPWAYHVTTAHTVYVTPGNGAYVRTQLKGRGFTDIKVEERKYLQPCPSCSKTAVPLP